MEEINTIEAFSARLQDLRVMIIGDVMIDAYLWGNVTRISPEAPVPVVAVSHREQRLGGAANVALNIEALGAKPLVCSVLGNDDSSKAFMRLMQQYGMDRSGLVSSDDRMTTVKSRVIGNNVHIVRVDEETTRPLSAADEEELLQRIGRILKSSRIDAIVFQDYDKGCVTPRIIEEVTALANKQGIITTVDPKHRNFKAYHDITLFKPNLKELREGLNVDVDESSSETLLHDLNQAAALLHQSQQPKIVFITLGNKGIYACDFRGKQPASFLLPAHLRAISDVSGAGDTVISVATLAMAAGIGLEQVIHFANMAGGIVCEQVGVVPIDKERLLTELREEQAL